MEIITLLFIGLNFFIVYRHEKKKNKNNIFLYLILYFIVCYSIVAVNIGWYLLKQV